MRPLGVRLEARDVSLRYADLVALDIDGLAAEGQIIALIGHNGAGKSTLIKALLGLFVPYSGSLCVRDSLGRVLVPERDMAFCPENGAVFADISVESYCMLWCRIKHNSARYYRNKGAHYVERLGIEPLLRKKGRELSKGQRRRVQTALGFMSDPRFFIFDEPFDGLDVQRTNELMQIVEEERANRAFLISSHRMDVMERLADLVVVLQNGKVVTVGDVSQVCRELAGAKGNEGVLSLTDAMRIHLQAVND
jgi:ABC-type multidrug transport system ATPase subunit